jgi:peptidoglycan biosynthesis protein MviN/MurJ (putative lipid II flippase)
LRGNFPHELAQASAVALRLLVFAIPAYSMTEFFSRVCYSCAEVRSPAIASWTGIAVSLAFGVAFLRMDKISVPAVALSVVCGQTMAGILLLIFNRRFFATEDLRSCMKYGSLMLGNLFCMASMWMCRDFLRKFLHFSDAFQNFLVITLVFTVGFMVYSIWLLLVKIVDISKFRVVGGNGNI